MFRVKSSAICIIKLAQWSKQSHRVFGQGLFVSRVIIIGLGEVYWSQQGSLYKNGNTVKSDPAQIWSRVIACVWTNKGGPVYFWQLVQVLIKSEVHVTGILKIVQYSVFSQGLLLVFVRITSHIFRTHNKSKNTNAVKIRMRVIVCGWTNKNRQVYFWRNLLGQVSESHCHRQFKNNTANINNFAF